MYNRRDPQRDCVALRSLELSTGGSHVRASFSSIYGPGDGEEQVCHVCSTKPTALHSICWFSLLYNVLDDAFSPETHLLEMHINKTTLLAALKLEISTTHHKTRVSLAVDFRSLHGWTNDLIRSTHSRNYDFTPVKTQAWTIGNYDEPPLPYGLCQFDNFILR